MGTKVVYFALVSFDDYAVGDLIPSANDWPFIQGYVNEGKVAPCLVATLPEDVQDALAELDEDEEASGDTSIDSTDPNGEEEDEDEDEDEDEEVDYHDLTIPDLKEQLEAREIDYTGVTLKDDLIALLVMQDEADAEDGDDDSANDDEE